MNAFPRFRRKSDPRPPRHSLRRPAWGGLLASALSALIVGCPPDTRIDVQTLGKMESRQAASSQPVVVDESKIELTDYQPYRVAPGDILTLHMTGLTESYEESVVKARVHVDGKIDLPMVGRLDVHGLDLESVERAVVAAYVPKYVRDLSVFIEATGIQQTTVFVGGAAVKRGLIKLPRNQRNVLYAVQKAGGYGPGSAMRVRVVPMRASQPPEVYDLTDVNDLRRALTARPLESGDLVIVEPADFNAVYAMGLVNNPGPIEIPPGSQLTVSQILAAAGGTVEFLDPDEATLWRTLPDGRRVRVKLDLAAIQSGKQGDLPLHAGDVLEVPHTAKTLLRRWAVENIQIGPFGVQSVYDPLLELRSRKLANTNRGNGFFSNIFNAVGLSAVDRVIGGNLINPATGAAVAP